MGAVITGVGVALPEKTITNADLEARMDTTDAWIVERTGIHERRIGGTTAGLATEAGNNALADAGLGPDDIDLLVLATTSPDRQVPGTSATVCAQMGLRAGACDGPGQLLGWDLGADGNAEGILYADHGDYIRMEGREVFRRATRVMVDSSQRALAMAGLTTDDVDLLVPHQANIRIIKAANDRLGIPMDKTAVVIHRTGNSSSATIPTALCDAIEHGRVHDGSIVLLVGFGAGLTWAAAVLRWGEGRPGRR